MTAIAIMEMRKEVKEYIDLADERMLRAIRAMLETDLEEEAKEKMSGDWWDEISDGEKASIEEGIQQLENGEGIPHAVVMKKYSKWLKK